MHQLEHQRPSIFLRSLHPAPAPMSLNDITIPEDIEPPDYSYTVRRAELLRFSIEGGHPDTLSRTRFAERYDVAPSTITRDMQAIRAELAEEIGAEADFISHTIYQKALRDAADRQAWLEAVEVLESWHSWLFNRGYQQRATDKHELDHGFNQEAATDALRRARDRAVSEFEIDTDDEERE